MKWIYVRKRDVFMPWLPRHQNFAGKLHIRFYIIWDCVVTQMKSVVKKCFHLQFCYANRNFLSWSHLVQNVKLYSQSPFLRCSSTLDDKRSCNRLEVNGPKTPAHQASQQKCWKTQSSELVGLTPIWGSVRPAGAQQSSEILKVTLFWDTLYLYLWYHTIYQ